MSNIFSCSGEKQHDRWLVNGSPVFSVFPGGIVEGIDSNIPIFLKVGTPDYGEKHIRKKHAHWVKIQKFNSVAELVYFKLAQPGEIYCTEADKKIKIMMRLNPSAIMVMELFYRPQLHFSVTTLYYHQNTLDGKKLGRYPGRAR